MKTTLIHMSFCNLKKTFVSPSSIYWMELDKRFFVPVCQVQMILYGFRILLSTLVCCTKAHSFAPHTQAHAVIPSAFQHFWEQSKHGILKGSLTIFYCEGSRSSLTLILKCRHDDTKKSPFRIVHIYAKNTSPGASLARLDDAHFQMYCSIFFCKKVVDRKEVNLFDGAQKVFLSPLVKAAVNAIKLALFASFGFG